MKPNILMIVTTCMHYTYVYMFSLYHMQLCIIMTACSYTILYLLVGAVSIPTLLIGYYHGLLLRDIDADQLTDKMCSTGLLTDHQQTVIYSGHTVHHRNWLLLEYVRQLDLESLLNFSKLLQEEWPEIGTQLIMGKLL